MKATAASVAHSDTASVQKPAVVYLESLHSSSGGRGLLRALNCAVSMFTDGNVTDAREFDWSQMSPRYLESCVRSWAVMMRVRTIVEQAGLDPLTPNDLRLPYSTEQQRLAARRQEEGFGH